MEQNVENVSGTFNAYEFWILGLSCDSSCTLTGTAVTVWTRVSKFNKLRIEENSSWGSNFDGILQSIS